MNLKLNEKFFLMIEKAKEITEEISSKELPKSIKYKLINHKRTFAQAGRYKRGNRSYYSVHFSVYMAKMMNEDEIINTLIHEFLHVLYFDDKHSGQWRKYANKFNKSSYVKKYGKITRAGIIKEKNRIDDFKYIIECIDCGFQYKRYKKSPLVKKYHEYSCHKCRGKLKQTR